MKRTKDGGAKVNGIKLSKYEFERFRTYRDIIRFGIIALSCVISYLFLNSEPDLIIAMIFLMVGWRMKVGW